MLSAGNPYVLPSVLVGATVYLGLSFFTDLTVLVRVGILVGLAGVVPVVANRVVTALRGGADDAGGTDAPDEAGSEGPGDEPTR
jgi:quinol-cytochrome oxidoreductase complex cytochrome b subunit